ncbi:MAG TPA: FAD-containing oxidoreductase [Steroidobacteraceae bacterium]
MPRSFDALIVGAGQAGPSLAGQLARRGMKVALIERSRLGGTCVNTGCVPTKAMVASAYAAHMARRAAEYGVGAGDDIRVQLARVKARKDDISAQSRSSLTQWLSAEPNVTVVFGHARFQSADTLRVGDELFTARQIFLNVGARPFIPPMPGLASVPYLTNATLMELTELPQHLIVVGGSYIGLEFGQMFRRFGARVTIVEKGPALIGREDEDVSTTIRQILEGEGIQVRVNSTCIALERHGDDVVVQLDCADADKQAIGTHVLIATGRTPNTDDLDLDRAGVVRDDRGYIQVDDRLGTNVEGIWALGDCNGRGAFTHTSYNDFEIVAANLLEGESRRVTDRIETYGLFIDPPLGRVGMTERQARESGRQVAIGTRPMTRVGRAVERGESLGFMKVLVDTENREILGAAILGVGGDEAIHAITSAMYAKAPYTTVTHAMHIHPTVAELLPTVLGELKPLGKGET